MAWYDVEGTQNKLKCPPCSLPRIAIQRGYLARVSEGPTQQDRSVEKLEHIEIREGEESRTKKRRAVGELPRTAPEGMRLLGHKLRRSAFGFSFSPIATLPSRSVSALFIHSTELHRDARYAESPNERRKLGVTFICTIFAAASYSGS